MKDTKKTIEYKGVTYPLVFNINVMEAIQEKYESFEEWTNLTDKNANEVNFKALKFGIEQMINEGIDIENEEKEEKREFVNSKLVGRLITTLSLETAAAKLQETVIDSTKSDEIIKNV